jgi:malate dehydrogenase (quinone)
MVDIARAEGAEPQEREVDVVLVGAGIMSATLGVTLTELQPELSIEMFEVLEREAQESSSAWNNAGTGHAALCELNYTPPRSDGSIDISKALEVNVEFDLSRQLWSYLVRTGAMKTTSPFSTSGTPRSRHTRITGAWSTRPTSSGSPNGSRS